MDKWNAAIIIAFVIAIVLIAYSFYIRQSYQSTEIFVSMPKNISGIYPYQKVVIPIVIRNIGNSEISGMGISLDINGNLNYTYVVTLPPSKQTTIYYNFTPAVSKTYNISVIADQGGMYNIKNRAESKNETTIYVGSAAEFEPFLYIPLANANRYGYYKLTNGGLISADYVYNKYGLSLFDLFGNSIFGSFMLPFFNITINYINNVSASFATYKNNTYALSIWINGYINETTFDTYLQGKGIAVRNITIDGNTVSEANYTGNVSVCDWYNKGWTEIILARNLSCIDMISNNASEYKVGSIQFINQSLVDIRSDLNSSNITSLGYFGIADQNQASAGIIGRSDSMLLMPTISVNSSVNETCSGIINVLGNRSFCSTYLPPTNGSISGLSLIRTTGEVGNRNLSVFSLVNTSKIDYIPQLAAALIEKLNYSGSYTSFKSIYTNTCNFSSALACNGIAFNNGTATLHVKNILNKSMRINSIACYVSGNYTASKINETLTPNSMAYENVTCYQNGRPMSGLYLSLLRFNLILNYSVANKTSVVTGNATVSIFGNQ
ncbi:MAG: CARDB domain-containing protein [Candidatus Micrarchaeia archaeon]